MSEKRRAEIEAKRAKLAELRKARADRQKADAERRVSEVYVSYSFTLLLGILTLCILILFRALVVPRVRVGMWTTWSMRSSAQAAAGRAAP